MFRIIEIKLNKNNKSPDLSFIDKIENLLRVTSPILSPLESPFSKRARLSMYMNHFEDVILIRQFSLIFKDKLTSQIISF